MDQSRRKKITLYARKLVLWTPANIFCSERPISSDVYTLFRRKIQHSDLRLLFTSILMMGILLDILTVIYLLLPSQRVNIARLSVFIILSCLNIFHHLLFLLLRIKKEYTAKYQCLVSTASILILIYLTHQFQALHHPRAPVQVWITLGLLQTLVASFYFQGSFVFSMAFWISTTLWISSGDSAPFNLLVCAFLILTSIANKHLYHNTCVK